MKVNILVDYKENDIDKNEGNYSAPHLEYIDFWAKRRK